MMHKIKDKELVNIAQMYNDEGRQAAYALISSYGIKQPYAVIRRMKKHPSFDYEKETDTFIYQDNPGSNDVFMSMEELCPSGQSKQKIPVADHRSVAMEKLIQELLGDRLLELSKYITLESSSKTMMIDQTSLKSAGYKVVTY
jgi:hypothetical protein